MLLMRPLKVPPLMYSVMKLSLFSLYSTPMNFSTLGCSRQRITFTCRTPHACDTPRHAAPTQTDLLLTCSPLNEQGCLHPVVPGHPHSRCHA